MVHKTSISLPPLRRKIRKSFSLLIVLYVLLGTFMMASVYFASGVSPKMIHLNYDPIAAAQNMQKAWYALRTPDLFPKQSFQDWQAKFEKAIFFAENNVTEQGEKNIINEIRSIWGKSKHGSSSIPLEDYIQMQDLLDRLVDVNESGMFTLAQENKGFGEKVFLWSLAFFILTAILAVYLGDSLATRLSLPLKDMAEALKEGPDVGDRLRLPAPTSLEIRILGNEIKGLWDKLAEFRKTNIEELAAQKEHLQTVLASVEDAILVLDNQNRVLHCSEGMLKILNLPLAEVIEQPWYDLPAANENYLKLRSMLKHEMINSNPVELSVLGKRLAFAGRHREIVAGLDQNIGHVYLLHDITETRHRERLKSEFIGVLSHELKTPLQSLGTAAELLSNRKKQFDSESEMLIDTINEDISRIRAVANDFMQVGLTDQHALKPKMERVPISQLLQEWIRPFKVLARDKQVKLNFEQQGSEVIWANIDVIKFPWAVSNLLSNAIRVSSEDSHVTVLITDRRSTEFFSIDILDEGPGIPVHIQKRMFEPYFQAATSESGTATGFLGLGLTIAKEVVEAHEGKIEYLENKPHGSVFRISLPTMVFFS